MPFFQDCWQQVGHFDTMDSIALTVLRKIFILLIISQLLVSLGRAICRIPFPSYGLSFHSRSVSNVKFMTNAVGMVQNGLKKCTEKAFQLLRSDGNIIVLPPSAVQEWSSIPPEIADGTKALEHDLMGSYTGLDFMLKSRLHHRVVQRKITPNLGKLTPLLEDELNQAVQDLFPREAESGWTTVRLYPLLLALTARTSARAFVGTSFCRNQQWLDVATNYVENLFRTVVILRAFPSWLHPLVSCFLPSYWKGRGYFRRAPKVLGPYIQEHLDAVSQGKKLKAEFLEPCALNWLVELAEGSEKNPERISHTETVLSLAGIHTMLLRQLSVIYDLTSHPEYLQGLLEEITNLTPAWQKGSYNRLRKLDSFMRESQRMSPQTILGLKRIMQQPYTLEDGTYLPKGSYVCVAAYAIGHDSRNFVEPETFDGFRSFKEQGPDEESNTQAFAATGPTLLGFGCGKTACPGRFFASLVIKMSFVKLISEYEIEFLPGHGRPKNWVLHEFLFVSPWDQVRIRKKKRSICPF